MSITKCRKIGNSQGVLLPAQLLWQLRVSEGQAMSASVCQGAIVLRPVSARTEKILSAVPDLMARHHDALQSLGDES